MGKFDDLLPDEAAFVTQVVDAQRSAGCEAFLLMQAMDGASMVAMGKDTPSTSIRLDRMSDAFFDGLERHGYLLMSGPKGHSLRPTKRAFDYARYSRRRWPGRTWEDLTWELGHDETARSKMFWMLTTLLISAGVTKLMSLIGWI